MGNVTTLDSEQLRHLYSGDPTAKMLLDHFAARQRDRTENTLDRLYEVLVGEGKPVARADLVRVLRALQGLGAGLFILGRKGHPSRFRWIVSSVQLGKAAAGEEVSLQVPVAPEAPSRERDRSDVISHRFVLRPDFNVSFLLPSDLSTSEASRLADFIRTLPFDKQGG